MKNIVISLFIFFTFINLSFSQDTLSYIQFQPFEDSTAEIKLANYINPNIEYVLVRRGIGLKKPTGVYGPSFLANLKGANSFAESVTNKSYLEIVVKPKAYGYISLSSLFFDLEKSEDILTKMVYSLDNGKSFVDFGYISNYKSSFYKVDLWKNSVFKNIKINGQIIFRLYAWSDQSVENSVIGFSQPKSLNDFAFILTGFVHSIKPPGVSISHIPKYKNYFIGGPSICVLPNGTYIVSHDYFGPNKEARVGGLPRTLIFKSEDKGLTWTFQTQIEGSSMSNLFYLSGNIYLLGLKAHDKEVVIRKSSDKGLSWSNPVDSKSGIIRLGKHHSAPTPVLFHQGRIFRAIEDNDGDVQRWPTKYRAFIMSSPDSVDLLDASNWTFSNSLPYLDKDYLGGYGRGWIEGNAVLGSDGSVKNILRVHTFDKSRERAAVLDLDSTNTVLSFDANDGFIDFPGGMKKFTIRFDSISQMYYSLANYVKPEYQNNIPLDCVRNQLFLIASKDLKKWNVKKELLFHPDSLFHAFQYVDWQFDHDDIVFVSRTAFDDGIGGAKSYHDSNYLTFHRIINYRKL